jgi:hypothetical protein
VLAPAAVIVVLLAEPHKVDEVGVKVKVGFGFTTTVIVFVLLHPPIVPVTVYVVVTVGDAVGAAQPVQLNPVTGNHE